jgi:endoglucanase
MHKIKFIILILLLIFLVHSSRKAWTFIDGQKREAKSSKNCALDHGAIIRGDRTEKKLALAFTGGDFSDGGVHIREVLMKKNVKASFFFTGDFYRKSSNFRLISRLVEDCHYLGPHSDKHLLYCSWEDRESLLVTKQEFVFDILNNYEAMNRFGIEKEKAPYFIPPYEWYNDTIAVWAKELGLILINFTPGTGSNADYTTPSMPSYRTSDQIYKSIISHEKSDPNGLNGFMLLIHIGTHPDRKDKFYHRLEELIDYLHQRGYVFLKVDDLLADCNPE